MLGYGFLGWVGGWMEGRVTGGLTLGHTEGEGTGTYESKAAGGVLG